MIVAKGKPLSQVVDMVSDRERILVAACAECVTVCQAGGEKEAVSLAQALRLWWKKAGVPWTVETATIQRQCEPEWVEEAAAMVEAKGYDAIISMACGVGVQFLARRCPKLRVVPALDTMFGGGTVAPAVWQEFCGFCGDCVLDKTAGVCPVVRCAKSLSNGPCGGSSGGHCEVSPDIPCAWVEIYERLLLQGHGEDLEGIVPPKDWSKASLGPRKVTKQGGGGR